MVYTFLFQYSKCKQGQSIWDYAFHIFVPFVGGFAVYSASEDSTEVLFSAAKY